MKPHRFQEMIAAKRTPVGHMIVDFNVRGIAKILESAGVDFVLVDMEHGGFDHAQVADLIAWFKATPISVFVRVPVGTSFYISRVLDAGAEGVMVPNVHSAQYARDIVSAAKYRPVGKRGLTFSSAVDDYALVSDVGEYTRRMNRRTTVICQIESQEGLEELDEIAAIDGVDVLWIGQYDLTDSLGILGDFQHPEFQRAFRRLIDTAHRHGKLAAIQGGSVAQLQEWIKSGMDVVSFNDDMSVYVAAMSAALRELRRA